MFRPESPPCSPLNPAAPGAPPIAPGGLSRLLPEERRSRLYAKQLVLRLRRSRSPVTNQAAINGYLSMVLGIERDMFFQPEFASVSTVRASRDLYAVRAVNDCAHLYRE